MITTARSGGACGPITGEAYIRVINRRNSRSMTEVHKHYDEHLGPIYEWMAGPFETACVPSMRLFEEHTRR